MKKFWIIISFSIVTIFTFFVAFKFESGKTFLPFYFFPNGFVGNASHEYSGLIGSKIYTSKIAESINSFLANETKNQEINFYDKSNKIKIQQIELVEKSKWQILYDFRYFVLIAFLCMLASVWFYLQDRDIHIFFLFLSVSSFVFSSFALLAFNDLFVPYYFSLFLIPCFILNLSFRLNGKGISAKWIVVEIMFGFIYAFVGYSEKGDYQLFEDLSLFGIYLILASSLLFILIVFYNLITTRSEFINFVKKISLVIAIMSISFIPYSFLKFDFEIFNNYAQTGLFFTLLFFPIFFVYGTYRYSFIPVQIFFSKSITAVYLIGIFIGAYLLIYLTLFTLKPGYFKRILPAFHLFYLFFSMLVIALTKEKLSDFIDYFTFKKNQKLNSSLIELADLIANPISLKGTISSLVNKVMETLDVGKIVVLIPGERFPRMELGKISLMKIPSNSEIWNYFSKEKQITATSYLTYGTGVRESVYKFLRNMEIQLAYPMLSAKEKKVESVFLVGEKRNRKNFTLGELRYIKECTRFANLLLENYSLLTDEVEKKKLVRELHFASIIDHIIHPLSDANIDGVQLSYLSIPAVGISGDYLEIVKIDNSSLLVMLGDVAGHGLGSGYLVSAVKAIARQHLKGKIDLEYLFLQINNFLIERYSGNEFMTLIGGILDIEKSEFTFINAGHLPLMILRNSSVIEVLSDSQRVLGIRQTEYKQRKIQISNDEKLFLFSDGITETFNAEEQTFGEERLIKLLKENFQMQPKSILDLIVSELKNFRKSGEITDDISAICVCVEKN